ncbi:hypothetical protein [Sclerotinia sclerotiorum deltaflexivirus 3S2]|nr:hypothetical protein [Sclerotinia sclerotiorum deltaflexivirus 3S2]
MFLLFLIFVLYINLRLHMSQCTPTQDEGLHLINPCCHCQQCTTRASSPSHLSYNPSQISPSTTPPIRNLNRSNNPLSRSCITPMGKVTAFLGDISHKQHVVEHFQQIGELVNSYFSNSHQAWYVQTYHPELVPDSRVGQRPSIHTIGTIFEHNFQTDTQFRFEYLRWLPVELERAPELPPRAVSPLAI